MNKTYITIPPSEGSGVYKTVRVYDFLYTPPERTLLQAEDENNKLQLYKLDFYDDFIHRDGVIIRNIRFKNL